MAATLRAFVDDYALSRDIRPGTIEQLLYAVQSLDKHLGRPSTIDDLNQQCVNTWLAWCVDNLARSTVHGRRGAILSLWRDAWDNGITDVPPRRIRPVKKRASMPEAWTLEEMGRVILACNSLRGSFRCNGISRPKLMAAWFTTSYYTGLRPCDMMTLRVESAVDATIFAIRQVKTAEPVYCPLNDDVRNAIRDTLPPDRELVFPLRRKVLKYWCDRITARAGVRGTPKWARRTGATQLEIVQPGAAMSYLGHKTPGLAYKHYVDHRQTQQHKPLPPRPGAA